MKTLIKHPVVTTFIDILSIPFSFLSAIWLKFISIMIRFLPVNRKIFSTVGVFPVRDHYYQPLINPLKHLKRSLREERFLPGIDFNTSEQLAILKKFNYTTELDKFPLEKERDLEYFFNNGTFLAGDSEYLYNIIRLKKPATFIEIGSGLSTLMAQSAIQKNDNCCRHICIEPYEAPWINQLPVELIRKKLEDIDHDIFKLLKKNDILFIDSSHIIRPQGDVLLEYLQVLPQLNKGVFIHVHDIFTPRDYLDDFIFKYHYLWNEQYLLEALLTNTSHFKIIGALNFLKHNFFEELTEKCPTLKQLPSVEPGSFWMEKI